MNPDDRLSLIRAVRQRLESLGRAGLDRLALPDAPRIEARPIRQATEAARIEPPPSLLPAPRPARPAPVPVAAPAVISSLFEEPSIDEPMLRPEERPAALASLAAEVSVCTRCPVLVANRTQTVFGTGSPSARLMFVGEAPGADEDRTGVPFIGRAGSLLTDMITKGMGLTRAEVYIANAVKSRPPENRTPLPDEVSHCLPYLEREIQIVRPEFLCLLGKTAVSALLQTSLPMNRLRGKWHRYRGIPTVVTWHPAYLLRNPAAKRETWDDLQLLMQAMGLKLPPKPKKS